MLFFIYTNAMQRKDINMNKHAEIEFINGALQRRLIRADLVAERDRLMLELNDRNISENMRKLRDAQLRDVNLKINAL